MIPTLASSARASSSFVSSRLSDPAAGYVPRSPASENPPALSPVPAFKGLGFFFCVPGTAFSRFVCFCGSSSHGQSSRLGWMATPKGLLACWVEQAEWRSLFLLRCVRACVRPWVSPVCCRPSWPSLLVGSRGIKGRFRLSAQKNPRLPGDMYVLSNPS